MVGELLASLTGQPFFDEGRVVQQSEVGHVRMRQSAVGHVTMRQSAVGHVRMRQSAVGHVTQLWDPVVIGFLRLDEYGAEDLLLAKVCGQFEDHDLH